jgi:hypothetical protein
MRVLWTVRRAVVLIAILWGSGNAFADVVTPTADVTSRVIVRASASSQSARVGSLFPGQALELVGSVPSWYEVRLTPRRHTRAARMT